MDVVPGSGALRRDLGRLLFAIGVFDGLHRGHRYLLRRLRRAAERLAARPAVITFDHHPDEVLRGHAPPLLCDPEERLVRLARLGVAVTVVEHFDLRLRRTPYDLYVEGIRERVELAGFVMTPDAAFGYERRGTPEALAPLAASQGWRLVLVPPLVIDGEQVRSADIRRRIEVGDLDGARRLLGRRYAVAGRLVGEESGRGVLAPELPVALPPRRSYRVWVEPAWRLADLVSAGHDAGRAAAGGDPPALSRRVSVLDRDEERLFLAGASRLASLASDGRLRVVFDRLVDSRPSGG